MTVQGVDELRQAAAALAARDADHAFVQNDVGFNQSDTWYGHSIAALPVEEWTAEVAAHAWHVLVKYRRQLDAYGIDFDAIPRPSVEWDERVREDARDLASSEEGDLVLDPFCGCGTAVASAQRLRRRWIGIDITYLAIGLIKRRLTDAYGDAVTYSVIGEPVSLEDAEVLAREDPYQFQWWALDLVGARPHEEKKGADKGVDGRIFFHDEASGGKTKQIILSVKAGKTGSAHVDQLRGVLDKEGAEIGALISFQEPTKPMRENAAGAGFYTSPTWGTSYPRIQLLTVGDLLSGKARLEYPHVTGKTFRTAPKATAKQPEPEMLPGIK